jgi:hypothetical protein
MSSTAWRPRKPGGFVGAGGSMRAATVESELEAKASAAVKQAGCVWLAGRVAREVGWDVPAGRDLRRRLPAGPG